MEADYFRYPIGSPEHFAAYERYFNSLGGIGFAFPDDLEASYEADFACELASERAYGGWCESGYRQYVEEGARWWRDRGVQVAQDSLGDPRSWLGGDWSRSRITERDSEQDIDPEAF
jgi:hypothetical protein